MQNFKYFIKESASKFKSLAIDTYLVGGAVRNQIMGLPAKDKDYVIAATEEEFRAVFPDEKEVPKVGESFPVFLVTGDETALTRIHHSTGEGYRDFEITGVGVPIEDDLARRDFTMNSIARNVVTGKIIDPFGGVDDIHKGLIRTVNDEFVKEDPMRVYRAARFAAEFDFEIEDKTAEIIRRDASYIKNVNPERVYVELKKVYERCMKPSTFFRVLLDVGVLQHHFKPLYVMTKIKAGPFKHHGDNTAFEHAMNSFDYAKQHGYSFDVALAGLFHDTGKGVSKKASEGEDQKHHGHEIMSYAINKKFITQHRFTAKANELIVDFARHHMKFHQLEQIKNPIKLVRFYKKIKNKVDDMVLAANTDHPLSDNQLKILNDLKRTFAEAEINVPKEVAKKGKEATVNYVENEYAKKYKEIVSQS